jgi:hypothetical protein
MEQKIKKREWEAKLIGSTPHEAAQTILNHFHWYRGFDVHGKEKKGYSTDIENLMEALRAYSALHHDELEPS